MRTGFMLLMCVFFLPGILFAQHWNSSYPSAGFALNTVDILKPGYILIGGGRQSNDSLQVMFSSADYGLASSWNEDFNDGIESWNKSIAFADTLNGLGAGYQGRIISSSDGGVTWGNAVFPIIRNFNKIVNAQGQIYYAVGGMNDTIQTVIGTNNGGVSWSVLRDTAGPGFNSVFFTSPVNGFAVGDSGVILQTTNGGALWNAVTPPVQRNFTGITFINPDTGYIVGGLITSDTQTILQTVNGGLTWNVIIDHPGPCLRDISFAGSMNGYIVGDSAVFLQTMNGGSSWTQVSIPGSTTLQNFTAVKFFTSDFGAVTSSDGTVFVYTNLPGPLIQNEQALFSYGDTLTLSAQVNTYGISDSVYFLYSTSHNFDNAVATSATTLSSNSPVTMAAGISQVLDTPGTYYYTCVVTTLDSTYYGDTVSFIVSANYPQLTTLNGSNVTASAITLRGQVSNLPPFSIMYFEYQGVYDTNVITVAATPAVINDTLYHVIVAGISGLLPYTPYQVRLKAVSGNSTLYGNYITFRTTPQSLVVSTLPATNITGSSATLNGQVGYLPFTANVTFKYSLLGSSNVQSVEATPSSISDTSFYFPTAAITGLSPNSYYQYRIEVSDFVHTYYGSYNYFYNGGAEVISADSATEVTYNTATLNGHVNNLHFPANMYFYYTASNGVTSSAQALPAVISDTFNHTVTADIGLLQPFTQYNYSLYAIDTPIVLQSVNPATFYTGPGYHSSLVLNTEPATNVTSTSATINGMEANLPDTAVVYFDFWQSGGSAFSVAATPDSITDSLPHQFSANVTGLSANTLYLYRIKITGVFGTIYGDSLSFYNGENTIPNFDFENWTTITGERPVDWGNFFGGAQKVSPGANGSTYAVQLQSTALGMDVFVNDAAPAQGTGVNPGNGAINLSGGFAYTVRADTFSGMFKYNILTGDTAYILLWFKSAGQTISEQFVPITGNSGSNFQKISFPIHYTSSATPDSFILGFSPTNIFANFPTPGSTLTIDNLTFGASNPPILNGDFENWNSFSYQGLDVWTADDYLDFSGQYSSPDTECVNQTTNAWHGKYAVELRTVEVYGSIQDGSGDMSTSQPNHGASPNFPVNHRPVMLTGHYMFFPQNGDTMSVNCFLYKNGAVIGGTNFQTNQPVSHYTFFTALLDYTNGNTETPDSASIEIRTQANNAWGLSSAVIDYLAFDGYIPVDTDTSVSVRTVNSYELFNVYPNPANDYLILNYASQSDTRTNVRIFDMYGQQLYNKGTNAQSGLVNEQIDVSKLPSGGYLLTLQAGDEVRTQKFVIQR